MPQARFNVSVKQPEFLPQENDLCKSDRNGLSANSVFHSLGVS